MKNHCFGAAHVWLGVPAAFAAVTLLRSENATFFNIDKNLSGDLFGFARDTTPIDGLDFDLGSVYYGAVYQKGAVDEFLKELKTTAENGNDLILVDETFKTIVELFSHEHTNAGKLFGDLNHDQVGLIGKGANVVAIIADLRIGEPVRVISPDAIASHFDRSTLYGDTKPTGEQIGSDIAGHQSRMPADVDLASATAAT